MPEIDVTDRTSGELQQLGEDLLHSMPLNVAAICTVAYVALEQAQACEGDYGAFDTGSSYAFVARSLFTDLIREVDLVQLSLHNTRRSF